MTAAVDRHLLFGLLALQNGLIDQVQLVAAFQAWTRDKARSLAEQLVARGDLDAEDRSAVDALVARHIKKHGGDVEKSLAAVPANHSTRASLAALGEPEIEATLARVARNHNGPATEADDDPDRTATLSVGAATSDGQRFRLLRPHARGGLGEVFVALDAELHREVALKQILEQHADDPVSRHRFVAEAEITGGLEHPGVVPVYGLGTYGGGRPYYAMRFIRGDSLKEAIEHFHRDATLKNDPGRRTLELRKLLRRFLDVCNAIDYAHSRGVIHRDLKPANIILGRHGETLVVDWGLAKVVGRADPSVGEQTIAPSSSGSSETLPGSALGTPAYMSPEQAGGDLDRLSPRSDVYSLGATLYCLLTGRPPFEGDDIGAILRRVQAGDFPAPRDVEPTLDRALEAVCLKAMATKPAERYAGCRALADDVERWMADEPVSAYREPLARRARRWARRNRTIVATAAVALVAGVVGLSAVLVVQTQAKADIARALVRETQARAALAESNAKVRARYVLAEKAIKTFHTGVSEDFLLKNEDFKELRTKLLKEAAGFYGDLEKLLAGQTDAMSREALAAAYFQLAELTDKIGDKKEALAVHQKALALRRELAAASGADVEERLEVARSLKAVGNLQKELGDNAGALATHEEQRELAERLEAEDPTDVVRAALAQSHSSIAFAYRYTAKTAEALEEYQKALAIQQKLADANPAVTDFQRDLSSTHYSIGNLLTETGKPEEALVSYRKALAIQQKLADANPAVTDYQRDLSRTHYNFGSLLIQTGKPAEGLKEYQQAVPVVQKLADANPAVTEFQSFLATSHNNVGEALKRLGKHVEALKEYQRALAIVQKLVDANPTVTRFAAFLMNVRTNIEEVLSRTGKLEEARTVSLERLAIAQKLADTNRTIPFYQFSLGLAYENHGGVLVRQKRFAEALNAMDAAMAIRQKLAEADPKNRVYTNYLGLSHANRGWALVRSGSADGGSKGAADLRRGLELLAKIPDLSPETRIGRSWALALLAGLGADAKSGVTTAEAAAFADQAVAALRDAIEAGWNDPDELKEPDFDPIRGRDDFKKVLAELEAKSAKKEAESK
jgi:serine/threonine-protein kinase